MTLTLFVPADICMMPLPSNHPLLEHHRIRTGDYMTDWLWNRGLSLRIRRVGWIEFRVKSGHSFGPNEYHVVGSKWVKFAETMEDEGIQWKIPEPKPVKWPINPT